MTSENQNLLRENAQYFAQCFVQTLQDMVGVTFSPDPSQMVEGLFQPRYELVIMIHYTGVIQGEYALAMDEKIAAKLIGAFEEGMSSEDLRNLRPDTVGMLKEALNAAVGESISKLGQDFDDLTFLSPVAVIGEIDYPLVPCARIPLHGEAGSIDCMFVLNMVGLELGEKLQAALQMLKESSREASTARRNMQALLGTFPAGLVVLNSQGEILPGYSICTAGVVGLDRGANLIGMKFVDCIACPDPENSKQLELRNWIDFCHVHYNDMTFAELKNMCPIQEFKSLRDRSIFLDWIPLDDEQGVLISLIAHVEDYTEKRKSEAQIAHLSRLHEQNIEQISQIVNLEPDEISDFVYDTSGLLDDVKRIIRESEKDRKFVDTVFRAVHTIKGTSGQFKFNSLEALTSELETDLARIRAGATLDESGLDKILSGISEADGYIHKLEELHAKLGARNETIVSKASRNKPSVMVPLDSIRTATSKLQSVLSASKDSVDMAKILDTLQQVTNTVSSLITVDIRQYDGLLESAMERVANRLGKSVKLQISGNVHVDVDVFRNLQQAMTHLINNAVDHGIESVRERLQNGKLAAGLVQIRWAETDGVLSVDFIDDGAGVNLTSVRNVLLQNAEYTSAEINAMSDERLILFLFQPGFTTRVSANQISGRGVGLDVVKTVVEDLQGTILMETKEGKGTAVRMRIPMILAKEKERLL
jgi:signal transduction histidine kinase/CheY-specific phosphatase CheX